MPQGRLDHESHRHQIQSRRQRHFAGFPARGFGRREPRSADYRGAGARTVAATNGEREFWKRRVNGKATSHSPEQGDFEQREALRVSHLLDTNSLIDHLRRGPASNMTTRLAAARPGSVYLCSVVLAELYNGVHGSAAHQTTNLALIVKLRQQFASLPFDDRAAEIYGNIRATGGTRHSDRPQ